MFRDLVTAALGLVWATILTLVGVRFVSLLAGADGSSSLVQSLYHRSDFWVRPIFDHLGLADQTLVNMGGSFELASLLAFGVYLVAGSLLLNIVYNGVFSSSERTYAY